MADFLPAYERTTLNEGGYVLTNHAGDRGGQTYAGISRRFHPDWPGWEYLDRGETPPTSLVREFYKVKFWQPIQGDALADQRVAETIYDFGVNADPRVAVKLAQIVVGAAPDGVMGPVTLGALNAAEPELFRSRYALAKLSRYLEIVRRDPSQRQWLVGWCNRLLKEAA